MLIYLASPYSHEDPLIRNERYEKVLAMTAKMILKWNLIVYSPIVHNHPIVLNHAERNEKFAFDFWEKFDTKMLSRCDEMWVYTIKGWNESKGIKAEIEIARSLSIMVKYIDDNTQRVHNLTHV